MMMMMMMIVHLLRRVKLSIQTKATRQLQKIQHHSEHYISALCGIIPKCKRFGSRGIK